MPSIVKAFSLTFSVKSDIHQLRCSPPSNIFHARVPSKQTVLIPENAKCTFQFGSSLYSFEVPRILDNPSKVVCVDNSECIGIQAAKISSTTSKWRFLVEFLIIFISSCFAVLATLLTSSPKTSSNKTKTMPCSHESLEDKILRIPRPLFKRQPLSRSEKPQQVASLRGKTNEGGMFKKKVRRLLTDEDLKNLLNQENLPILALYERDI
jgi:hypothetical protein